MLRVAPSSIIIVMKEVPLGEAESTPTYLQGARTSLRQTSSRSTIDFSTNLEVRAPPSRPSSQRETACPAAQTHALRGASCARPISDLCRRRCRICSDQAHGGGPRSRLRAGLLVRHQAWVGRPAVISVGHPRPPHAAGTTPTVRPDPPPHTHSRSAAASAERLLAAARARAACIPRSAATARSCLRHQPHPAALSTPCSPAAR